MSGQISGQAAKSTLNNLNRKGGCLHGTFLPCSKVRKPVCRGGAVTALMHVNHGGQPGWLFRMTGPSRGKSCRRIPKRQSKGLRQARHPAPDDFAGSRDWWLGGHRMAKSSWWKRRSTGMPWVAKSCRSASPKPAGPQNQRLASRHSGTAARMRSPSRRPSRASTRTCRRTPAAAASAVSLAIHRKQRCVAGGNSFGRLKCDSAPRVLRRWTPMCSDAPPSERIPCAADQLLQQRHSPCYSERCDGALSSFHICATGGSTDKRLDLNEHAAMGRP